MRRNLKRLGGEAYDVVVIGGGIYGICVARDAALRGLRVALVEQKDFGHATSSNHHRIIHGGFRYLQHGDFTRMRESIRERRVLLRIAPHLVRPLPFLIPTTSKFIASNAVFSAALKLNDLIGFDRNRGLKGVARLPAGRVISKDQCLRLCPETDQLEIAGGALFFDAQVHNADRLNLAVLHSAAEAGAEAVNYVEATDFCKHGDSVVGVKTKDLLGGHSFDLKAKLVVNCAGPWAGQLLERLGAVVKPPSNGLCKSWVLVTRRLLAGGVALGVPSRLEYQDHDAVVRKGFRYLFITPWRDASLVGTFQSFFAQDPRSMDITAEELDLAIGEVNAALPQIGLRAADVSRVLCGLVPGFENAGAQLQKQHEIRDHAMVDGIKGLISVCGVKYTTARGVAEQTVDLIFRKLGQRSPRCRTATLPVHGGAIDDMEQFRARALAAKPPYMERAIAEHLIDHYGTAWSEIVEICEADRRWAEPLSADTAVTKAEVVHGIRSEMALKLSDILFRRTELATAGYPGDDAVFSCAEIMAKEQGWQRSRLEQEIEEVASEFRKNRVWQ